MVRNIDKVNGNLIQKVSHWKTGKVLRYQTIPDGMVGQVQATPHATLWAARAWAIEHAPKVEEAA